MIKFKHGKVYTSLTDNDFTCVGIKDNIATFECLEVPYTFKSLIRTYNDCEVIYNEDDDINNKENCIFLSANNKNIGKYLHKDGYFGE